MEKGNFGVISFYEKNGVWYKDQRTACFSGLSGSYFYSKVPLDFIKSSLVNVTPNRITNDKLYMNYIRPFEVFDEVYVLIDHTKGLVSEDSLNKLIELVNEITHCKIIKKTISIEEISHDDIYFKSYLDKELLLLKFDLLKTYDQNLILLNFIRNYWYSPKDDYSKNFFELLNNKEFCKFRDPLKILTNANKEACRLNNVMHSHGHSNTQPHNLLKVKTKQQLLDYAGFSTRSFLTT